MRRMILISLLVSMLIGCSAKIYDTSHKLKDKYNSVVKKVKTIKNLK